MNPERREPQPVPSILAEERMQDLIEGRRIDPKDHHLLESLGKLPKQLFLEAHNYFTGNKRDLVQALEFDLANTDESKPQKKEYYALFLELAQTYDWTACWAINSTFEKR